MKAFRVNGQSPFGSLRQKFSLDVVAASKDDAEHRVYSILDPVTRHPAVQLSSSLSMKLIHALQQNLRFSTTSEKKLLQLVAK